jgi:uncharacterized protein with HEPN domain
LGAKVYCSTGDRDHFRSQPSNPDELKAKRPEIEWRSIASIGNFLRHEYHTISDKVIWDVVQVDLPPLKIAIDAIAATIDDKEA